MNQRIWSGITVTLVTTALGTALLNPAQQAIAVDPDSEGNSSPTQMQELSATPTPASEQAQVEPTEVVKVGEFQSQATEEEDVVAKIHAYELDGRQAATLYVRSIPVLTFLGYPTTTANDTKVGETAEAPLPQSQQKVAGNSIAANNLPMSSQSNAANGESGNDAVWRATAIAAQLNQLHRDNLDAEGIAVRWKADCNCYSINVQDQELVQINENTILPDTTKNPAEDALQATNRLRRLMGNAPPLREIAGRPKPPVRTVTQVAIGPVRFQINGIASWYGPGFHGNPSASGERYNQNALTAAHRNLPFGTNVRVTNLNNGRSVVVRINDRGPFIGGRVIDLSAAAARMLGMIQTGTAPVRLEVLDTSR
ncbi:MULTISPECIES: septal ring lytic transglycosylase RlpA family protein [unclassified Coleofasciculus]|uniref:septal ring lytic transglycosylase RlpA family protein n=1 Tax=unclassified Coleofasciculus TaxID=2692782 RepID=UPI001881966E|nr:MULTISPECIES: septal ring lytic transglycosylase RlpA family protein [unclassified Coleofasciculus]MBE9124925.1 septal ring lytic transglycosylase RlpA family protein [Coleofasciculus sp. LEGE 07081]MBE9147949.1 septal ring lytic transglycosylase RlpA family protein [Coleofasciculus sp. LEGE 07092]